MTGVVIITWNSGEVIGACLDACLKLSDAEIVVVDNASGDDTVAQVRERPGVRLIANGENRGFATAANQGIELLGHPAVLLLNPDAVPLEGVAQLAELVTRPDIGAAAGKLFGADGRWQSDFNVRSFPTPGTLALEVLGLNRVFPQNQWNRRYRSRMLEENDREIDVDQPAGAFLMISRPAWQAVGGFDEGFAPVWFEDVDFCLRLKQAGYRILFVPSASARHMGGHSASRLPWDQRQLFWYRSLVRYTGKHFPPSGRRLVAAALMAACVPRTLFGAVPNRSLTTLSVYSKVFRVALKSWFGMSAPSHAAAAAPREENRAKQLYR